MSNEAISIIHKGRTAWVTESDEFTRVAVGEIGPIVWDTETSGNFRRVGSASLSLNPVLKDDIKEWMDQQGYEYDLTDDGESLVMFDLDAMLLLKLTWQGIS